MDRHDRADWFGPLLVTLVAVIGMAAFSPSFLSPLNVQVLLLALCINGLRSPRSSPSASA